MSYINIAEWTPAHVVQWLQGLDDSIQPYVNFFLDNQVNGCRLLLLTSDDLDKLYIKKIGHQEIILDSVDLLKHLHYNSTSENLQTLALKLGCKSRSLYNHLRKEPICGKCENCIINLQSPQSNFDNENEENELYSNLFQPYKKSNVVIRKSITSGSKRMCRKISTFTLTSVCDILNSVKRFITWIDRYSFEVQDYYSKIRQTILRISIELASTAQRDHFVENPKELIKNNCLKFAEICERIVQELNDSLCIQPACLELVPIRHKENEELGVKIFSSFRNVHVIGEIKMQSPVHRCGRIEEGDEIAQINYQTVLGWTQSKLIEAMKEYPTKILITIKKGPSHSRIAGQLKVLEPSKIPHRESIISSCKHDSLTNKSSVFSSYYYNHQPQQEEQQQLQEQRQPDNNLNSRNIYDQMNGEEAKKQPCCDKKNFTTTSSHKQLIEQISIEKPHKGPVYQMAKENKPKRKELKRRATICGTSPTRILKANANTPIRLEDLVNLENRKVMDDHDYDLDDNLCDDYNINAYKSFNDFNNLPTTPTNNIRLDHNQELKRKANLNKRTLSSDAELKKRSISAYGYDKIYYDFSSNNKESDYCLIRNGYNNATVISINNSNNVVHVQCNSKNESEEKEDEKLIKSKSQNHYPKTALASVEHCSPENKNLKINNNLVRQDADDVISSSSFEGGSKSNKDVENSSRNNKQASEEVLTRKKSQAKLIKNLNLNCKQLRNNSDHCGFLNFLREELPYKESASGEDDGGGLSDSTINKSSLNNSFKSPKKWRRNYFILKNDLLYFYPNDDDDQEPSRIINLPIFSLDDNLDYSTANGLNLFKIASLKHAFYFSSTDANELNAWIEKFKNIIINNFNPNSIHYHSFNNHYNTSSNKNRQRPKNLRLAAQSFRNLNDADEGQQLLLSKNGNSGNYFSNGVRSVSCVDSNLLNKYSRNNLNTLPPKQQFYLDQLTKQNHKNQVIEQNQSNQQKEMPPKPQPRFSKMKQQQQQSDSNFVGKIISSFDELSKQCEKELDYYSSLRKQPQRKDSNEENLLSPRPTKYFSVLDQEYNKLFKQKSPPPSLSNNSTIKTIKSATSKEIQSIYLKQHEKPSNNSLKCNSPISDNSSSSGISSYYSLNNHHQDHHSSSFEQPAAIVAQLVDKNEPKTENSKDKKQVQRKSSFNSFRLFGSSRVLSKLSSSSKENESNKSSTSSPASRQKRSFFGLRKNSLPTTNNNNKSSTLMNGKTTNNHLSRVKSKSSELLNNYIDHLSAEDFYLLKQQEKLNNNKFLTLNTQKLLLDANDTQSSPPQMFSTPETMPRNKQLIPCMGITGLKLMNNKRRSSTVSCDRMAIEQAIQLHNEKMLMQNN